MYFSFHGIFLLQELISHLEALTAILTISYLDLNRFLLFAPGLWDCGLFTWTQYHQGMVSSQP